MQDEETIYLTRQGYHNLEAELRQLSTTRRQEVAERIRNSKDQGEFGDDNPEFEEAKLDQAMVESRIQDLRQLLAIATIVEPDDVRTDLVGVGSIVKLMDLDNKEEFEVVLVGPIEADPDENKISYQSPVGDALMDCKVGDEISVAVPAGKVRYKVLEIRK